MLRDGKCHYVIKHVYDVTVSFMTTVTTHCNCQSINTVNEILPKYKKYVVLNSRVARSVNEC